MCLKLRIKVHREGICTCSLAACLIDTVVCRVLICLRNLSTLPFPSLPAHLLMRRKIAFYSNLGDWLNHAFLLVILIFISLFMVGRSVWNYFIFLFYFSHVYISTLLSKNEAIQYKIPSRIYTHNSIDSSSFNVI